MMIKRIAQVHVKDYETERALLRQITTVNWPPESGRVIQHWAFGTKIVIDFLVTNSGGLPTIIYDVIPYPAHLPFICSNSGLDVKSLEVKDKLSYIVRDTMAKKNKMSRAKLLEAGDKLAEDFERKQSAQYLARSVPAWWRIVNYWTEAGLTPQQIKDRAAERFKTTPPAELAQGPAFINERLLKRIELAAQFLEDGCQLDEDEA